MNRPLPIGVSDFRKMMEGGYYYIDKSLLIKELIDSGAETVLLPRPRRFGKTLNLSMLRYFFEKTDEDTSGLFRDLAIWRQGQAYTDKQGRFPVIMLTFKDVKCGDWAACERELQRVIGREYRRHQYVLDSEMLDEDEKLEFRDMVSLAASPDAYRNSLLSLSDYLERYYGRKTVILMDEYDTPIQEGFLHGYYDEIIAFMRHLLSAALKDNTSLEQGVLTGIFRVAKESIFSGLNNLQASTLLNRRFGEYFGWLEAEVEELLAAYGAEEDLAEVKQWYNGYVFGDRVIYNPWSILNYVYNREDGFRPYWVNTSNNDLIRQLLTDCGSDAKQDLERLVRGESIRKELNDNIAFPEVRESTSALWSFLLFSGYLKVVSKQQQLRLYGDLHIPNREVAYLYENIILGWFDRSIRPDRHRMMLESLANGDIATFGDLFGEFVLKSFSLFDTGGEEPEKVYHAFVLGLLVGMADSHEVRSNRESGYGRYDVMLIPRDVQRKGILIEFKKARQGETLEEAAVAALRQIEEKRYDAELQDRGIRDTIKLGIAFAGKQVLIRAM